MHVRLTAFIKTVLLGIALSASFSTFAQDATEGQKLFEANCVSCHAINEKLVGPALKDVHTRRQEGWLIKWIKNSQAMIKAGDPIAVQLSEEYNGAVMNSFENFSDNDVKNILAYIKEAGAAPAPSPTPTEGTATTVAPTSTTTGGGNGFYSNSTFYVLGILFAILLLITILLYSVNQVLRKLIAQKYPELVPASETNKVSWVDAKFKPWLASLNPTIATLVVVTVFAAIGGGLYFKYANEEIGVQQGYAPTQPINFSHEIHAGTYKMDCQYCHSSAAKSKQASVPSINTCMNCHSYVDAKDKYNGQVSPEIQKVRDAYKNNTPVKWVRIHNLPDHAYFNHAQHVSIGKVECQTCHGEIEKMPVVEQASSLQMGWCINCHREAKVDVANNDYYEQLHSELKKMGRTTLTVEKIGGLECGKCHY